MATIPEIKLFKPQIDEIDTFVNNVHELRKLIANTTLPGLDEAVIYLRAIMQGATITTLPNFSSVQSVIMGSRIYGDQGWAIPALHGLIKTNSLLLPLTDASLREQVANDHVLMSKIMKTTLHDHIKLKDKGYTNLQIDVIDSAASSLLNLFLHGDVLINVETYSFELKRWINMVGPEVANIINVRVECIIQLLVDNM